MNCVREKRMAKNYPKYLEIFRNNNGILKASDAIKKGIPEHVIYEMYKSGLLVREERGLYRLSEVDPLGNSDLVQVAMLIPKAVISLVSALAFHKLTTQIPHRVYVTLPRGVKRPRVSYPPIEFTWQADKPYRAGVEEQILDGVNVHIYSPEKTIADCFKFRNRIGQDVAIEALKDYIRNRKVSIDKLMEYARIDRVETIFRPYVESLVS
jgi:predicted transcriptional regulator of viral defense system